MGLNKFISKEGYKANSPDRNNPFNIIPSNNITMEGVSHPVMGIDNMGNQQMMYPGANYQFPGNVVTEFPMRQQGGTTAVPPVIEPTTYNINNTEVNDQTQQIPEKLRDKYHHYKPTTVVNAENEYYKTFGDVWKNIFQRNKPGPKQTVVFGDGGNYYQQDGGYVDMDLEEAEIAELRKQGYKVDIL